MSFIASIGTYLPCWGTEAGRVPGEDEDAITLAVEAGRAACSFGASVEHVILVSRDLPLLESSNAAVLLAGLGLDAELEVVERLGGAPATLDALASARPRTLVITVDLEPAGAAAAITSDHGLQVRTAARIARSLPVRTRDEAGGMRDYGDPRLLRARGFLASATAAHLWSTPIMVAGVDNKQAAAMCEGDSVALPTMGASSALFALAVLAELEQTGLLVGVEQANLSGAAVSGSTAQVKRVEPAVRASTDRTHLPGADIPISLAAYDRAFDAKVRWGAGKFADSEELDFPPRYRSGADGDLQTDYSIVPLPRTGTVYTEVTVEVPVPGLTTPYSLVIVELDDVDVRALVKVTGAEPGSVDIGDRGRMVLRRVAVRSGVPDYGYAFEPELEAV